MKGLNANFRNLTSFLCAMCCWGTLLFALRLANVQGKAKEGMGKIVMHHGCIQKTCVDFKIYKIPEYIFNEDFQKVKTIETA